MVIHPHPSIPEHREDVDVDDDDDEDDDEDEDDDDDDDDEDARTASISRSASNVGCTLAATASCSGLALLTCPDAASSWSTPLSSS
jgi:hypothetical protein